MPQRCPARTLTRRQLLTASGAMLAPAALLAWWRPWRTLTTLTAPVPTPPPPTATSTPERIALPTARPRPSTTPTATSTPAVTGTPAIVATPQRSATAVAMPAAASAAAGTLLHLGAVEGRRGVVAVGAEGDNRRIVVPGPFDSLAISDDGARLAVIGAIPDGWGVDQLTIYTTNGHALARFPIGRRINGTPVWSPNGAHLLCSMLSTDSSSVELRWETWVFGDDGARQITPPSPTNYILYGWTPDGRIAFITGEDPDRPRMQTLWTTDAAGGDRQKVYEWVFSPLGWNRDGSLLYALAHDDPDDHNAALARLIAIERPFGYVRYLASADALAVGAFGEPNLPGSHRFDFAHPSPDGTRFAIGIARQYGPGTPSPRTGSRATSVIFMHRDSQRTGVAPLPPGTVRGPAAWSPDGTRFALLISGERDGDGLLVVLNTDGTGLGEFPVERAYFGRLPRLAWSRNSQWLAYTVPRGLAVVGFDPPRGTLLSPGGTYPAWRPVLLP